MNDFTTATDLAHIIQLAVAPVFLLAGISGFLNVMSGRLGRIIDRSRVVNQILIEGKGSSTTQHWYLEFELLNRRTSIIQTSITLCTGSALLACILIVSLFIGDFLNIQINAYIVSFFVLTMLLLIAALILFLMEVQVSTRQLKLGYSLHTPTGSQHHD